MTTTITSGANTITASTVFEYQTAQSAQSVVHEIPGAAYPDVTFRPAGSRRGTLRAVFPSAVEANNTRGLLASVLAAWALSNPDQPTINMRFAVADGDINVSAARSGEWLVDIPYVEVAP